MKRLILTAIAIPLLGSLSFADLARGSQTVAVFGGWGGSGADFDYVPGNERPVTGSGGAFGAQYLYYVKDMPAIAFGADLTSSLNGNHRSGDLLSGFETTDRLKSLVGLMIARLSYPRGHARPYIFAGLGAHDSTEQLSATPQPGTTFPNGTTASQTLVDEHKTSAAFGYGIGMDVFLNESFFLGFELRDTWLASMDTDDNLAVRTAGFTSHETHAIDQGNIFFRAGVKF